MNKIVSIVIIMMLAVTSFSVVSWESAFAGEEPEQAIGQPALAGQNDSTEQTVPAEQTTQTDETEPAEQSEPTDPDEQVTEPVQFQDMVPIVSTTHKDAAIKVKWVAVKGAKTYKVYRRYSGKDKKKIAETSSLHFTDKTVISGKKATYYVRAYNKNKKSALSKGVSDKIYRVYIETGHGRRDNGSWDPGCKWSKYQEAKLMIPIAKATVKYLRANGVYVYTDAESGNDHNLLWTLRFIDRHSISAMVNIHCDYCKAKAGTLPLYRTTDQKKLATALNKGVHSTVEIKDRGLEKRKDLRTLNTDMGRCVACIFETGAIKKDNKILKNKYKAYGKGLAKGLCKYLNVPFE